MMGGPGLGNSMLWIVILGCVAIPVLFGTLLLIAFVFRAKLPVVTRPFLLPALCVSLFISIPIHLVSVTLFGWLGFSLPDREWADIAFVLGSAMLAFCVSAMITIGGKAMLQ